jgi:uncharacterized protein with GYD domain
LPVREWNSARDYIEKIILTIIKHHLLLTITRGSYTSQTGGLTMLFMVYHKHTAEMCPGGKVRPDKDFISKLNDQIQESGVELVGGYIDGPGHRFYMVIEADDSSKLNKAIEQLRLTGDTNEIIPVMDLSKMAAWAKKMGIQN